MGVLSHAVGRCIEMAGTDDLLLLLPGQGSQAVGMGTHIREEYPESGELFEQASDLLGWDVAGLCAEGPLEELTRTDKAQPALFVCSVATWRFLRKCGVRFKVAVGHSLGEYSALAATGQIDFADALRVVDVRGRAMWACGEDRPGAMAAILGLEDEAVEEICTRAGEAWPANYNSRGQVVISGSPEGVARAGELAKEEGAKKVLPLQVSGAFHSPLVEGAAEELRAALDGMGFRPPEEGRFFSSTEVRYPEPEEIPGTMVRQLTSPVRFRQSLEAVLDHTDAAIEVGPGGVLAGLAKRFDRRFPVFKTDDTEAVREVIDRFGAG